MISDSLDGEINFIIETIQRVERCVNDFGGYSNEVKSEIAGLLRIAREYLSILIKWRDDRE